MKAGLAALLLYPSNNIQNRIFQKIFQLINATKTC